MRHFAGRLGAILLSVSSAAYAFAADAADCTDCTVANAIADAIHEGDRSRSAPRARYWLLSYESATVAGWRRQFGVAIGGADLVAAPFADASAAAMNSNWTIGLRFEVRAR